MRDVSPAFLRTLTGSHEPVFQAIVCGEFQTGVEPTGTAIKILDGDVTIDGTADVRSTLDLTTDGNGMWPVRATDPLTPYGNEIYVRRGIKYSDNAIEWVGLGYFLIEEPDQDEAPNGPIQITAKDRMQGIIDARLLAPRQFDTTASLGFIVSELVTEVYPEAVISWDDDTDDEIITRTLIVEEDRYGFIDNLVRARSKTWYWDHSGQLVIKDIPSSTEPVWDVFAGEGGALVELSRKLSRRTAYNAVVATGEATDTFDPVRGVAIDDNPQSPTYYYGRFLSKPRYFSSPLLFTAAQARTAARTELTKNLGLPYKVDLKSVPNPALEPWDPIQTRARDERRETHVVESLRVPLTASGQFEVSTKEQTVVLVTTS